MSQDVGDVSNRRFSLVGWALASKRDDAKHEQESDRTHRPQMMPQSTPRSTDAPRSAAQPLSRSASQLPSFPASQLPSFPAPQSGVASASQLRSSDHKREGRAWPQQRIAAKP